MTRKSPVAYRSDVAEVIQWWDDWLASEKAHSAALKRVAPKIAPWKGAKPAVVGAWGRFEFRGFLNDWAHPTLPDGWRFTGKDKKWVYPKKSTTEGKRVLALMATVPPFTDPRYEPGIPGVTQDFLATKPALGRYGDAMWMTWEDEEEHKVDKALWTAQPMSAYWLAKEAGQGDVDG